MTPVRKIIPVVVSAYKNIVIFADNSPSLTTYKDRLLHVCIFYAVCKNKKGCCENWFFLSGGYIFANATQ